MEHTEKARQSSDAHHILSLASNSESKLRSLKYREPAILRALSPEVRMKCTQNLAFWPVLSKGTVLSENQIS